MRLSGMFGTEAAMRAIGLFYLNPEQSYRLGEVQGSLSDVINRRALIDLLNRLVADGYIEKRDDAGYARYRASRRCYLYDELRQIAVKTFGGFEGLASAIDGDPNVVAAAVYGSFARGAANASSDIDLLLVVSDAADPRLFDTIGQLDVLGGRLGRQVNTTSYTRRDVTANQFLRGLLGGPLIWLKGEGTLYGVHAS